MVRVGELLDEVRPTFVALRAVETCAQLPGPACEAVVAEDGIDQLQEVSY